MTWGKDKVPPSKWPVKGRMAAMPHRNDNQTQLQATSTNF